jgi:hypothetical protein
LRSARNTLLEVVPGLRKREADEVFTTPIAHAQPTRTKRNGLLNRRAEASK